MPNACFRCKTPIGSGETFCADCSRKVDPSKLERNTESRMWVGVLAFPAWMLLAIPIFAVSELLLPVGPSTLVTSLTSLVGLVLGFAFLVALLLDADHLQDRDDVGWTPSSWLYYTLVAFTFLFLFLPAPFVAGYHLYKRHQTAGLPW